MTIQEHTPLGPKTTMKIGGTARYFIELKEKRDAEEAWKFSEEKNLPLIVLGAGSNTIFADGEVNAVVAHVAADNVSIDGTAVTAHAGCALATLVARCADAGLDLSALTGIPGTFGGAIVGNAGQGPQGTWLNAFIRTVTVFADGAWRTMTRDACAFSYRESIFKHWPTHVSHLTSHVSPIVWEAALDIPTRPTAEIKATVDELLKKRLAAQPYRLTAGSCFKAVQGTPAWKLIDAAGLRGLKVGGVMVSDKHANFLINTEQGTFADALGLITAVKEKVPSLDGIEMRLFGEDGRIAA